MEIKANGLHGSINGNEKENTTENGYIWTYDGIHECEGMILPAIFPESSIDEVRNFNFREGDIIVSTYPKAGTAWMQEIVWLVNNEADTTRANLQPINVRVPNIDAKFSEVSNATKLDLQQGQRFIKTHLPANVYERALNEGKAKFIVVLRNPKDTLVSYYNFYKMQACFGHFPGPWCQFYDMFLNKELAYGDWFDHVLGYWAFRDRPNVLVLKYEDMHRDPLMAVKQVTSFCNQHLSQEQLKRIVDHTSFSKMATNPQTNFKFQSDQMDFSKSKYMRKGCVGDWKNYFTIAQNEDFDLLYSEKMSESGLDIDFVI